MDRKALPSAESFSRNLPKTQENEPTDDRIEGRNPVLEAMRAGRTINKLYVAKRTDNARPDPTLARIINMAKDLRIPIMEVPKINLDDMSQTHNHQGVIAQAASHEYVEIDDMLRIAEEKGEAPLLLILDELKDAYNLGSILRIADAAGVTGVIIPQHRSIGLDSMVAKASAGAIEYVPVARVTNLSRTILELKEKGFWIAGTDADGTNQYFDDVWSGPMAIVIGSEGEGMNKNIREKCDFLLSIPMAGSVNSLNAAVAAGIVVFEAVRQRRKDQT
ncbi:MAG: 23S rRNA (guanosine(2251)-2'-O)-methyltransferase RlmB [Clostridiales bacterium]|nr:23S rRNA (guanosine(2251)-2'-O)-methyltransferase RlmB [Clostridiales bacterium]MBR5938704.1 23S rRNA (guanosine(2251)-2'-O)-methyltransferase RlmB [Clostridiales bacterium]